MLKRFFNFGPNVLEFAFSFAVSLALIYTAPSNSRPQSFENGELTSPEPHEKLKFYFGPFFINSLKIVILKYELNAKMQYSRKFSFPLYML